MRSLALITCILLVNVYLSFAQDYDDSWKRPTISQASNDFKYAYFGMVAPYYHEPGIDIHSLPPIPGLKYRSYSTFCQKDTCYAARAVIAVRCPEDYVLLHWASGRAARFAEWCHDDIRFLAPYLREMMNLQYRLTDAEYSIPKRLQHIEKEYDVKVLLAVLTGSRARGLESELSDWDVSCLYIHNPKWYESNALKCDSIQRVYRGDIDFYGWELKSALSFLKDGNPTILEWLNSPKVYYTEESFISGMQEIGNRYFDKDKAIAHYYQNITKFNEHFIVQGGDLKKTLHFLRGILSCMWIEKNGSIPPMNYRDLLDKTVNDDSLRAEIDRLINSKKEGINTGDALSQNLKEFVNQETVHIEKLILTASPNMNSVFPKDLEEFFKEIINSTNK